MTISATVKEDAGVALASSGLVASRRLAYVFGVLTPLAETLRRWGTWWDHPAAFLDDYFLGAFLVAGAWATRNPRSNRGRALLAAAWGFACGMAYSSTAFHWSAMRAGVLDPAPIPSHWVFAIKVFGSLVFVGALVLTVRGADPRSHPFAESPAPDRDVPSG